MCYERGDHPNRDKEGHFRRSRQDEREREREREREMSGGEWTLYQVEEWERGRLRIQFETINPTKRGSVGLNGIEYQEFRQGILTPQYPPSLSLSITNKCFGLNTDQTGKTLLHIQGSFQGGFTKNETFDLVEIS